MDNPISEDRARVIAAEEADRRTRRHEDACILATREMTRSIDNLWIAFDAFRGRLWMVAIGVIGGQFAIVSGLIAYIWTTTVGGN
jgi:hypothetical protein